MKHLLVLAALPLMLLAGCNKSDGGVKGAEGDTPVKYVICSQGEQNCFVSARFKDLDSCNNHKAWADMLCDKQSSPGKMICTTDTQPQIGVAYCTH